MTQDQIKVYEYCKKDIQQIKTWKEKLPFSIQNHGCGSGVPSIEHELEEIHFMMYSLVCQAIDDAINKIDERIKNI